MAVHPARVKMKRRRRRRRTRNHLLFRTSYGQGTMICTARQWKLDKLFMGYLLNELMKKCQDEDANFYST